MTNSEIQTNNISHALPLNPDPTKPVITSAGSPSARVAPTLPSPQEVRPLVENPFNTEAYQGSMQQLLYDNIGQFAVVEFLIGTQNVTQKKGIIYSVGRSYIVLYEELTDTYVVCDIFSVKFVTFYQPNKRPGGYSSPGMNRTRR